MDNKNSKKKALEIRDLEKVYTDGNVRAVDGVSFTVHKGEIFSLLGPNGAGKTTTISIAATALDPTSGSIKVFGHDVVAARDEVRKHIGICPQEIIIYENLSIIENVMFYGKMYRIPRDELLQRANMLIKKVGLENKRDTMASKLSGGMKRRLNLIMALVNEPDLVFMDEPTAGLDPQTRRLIWEYIKGLKAKGKTVLLTTHYMDEADELSDRVAIMDHGKIIAIDSPFDLKRIHSTGDILEFKFKEADAKVMEILERMNKESRFNKIQHVEEDNLFRVAITDVLDDLASILNDMRDQGLHVSNMGMKSNTLENVFISLTGRSLRD